MINWTLKEKFNYYEGIASEGFIITSYTEDQDIKYYSGCSKLAIPVTVDRSVYREITLAEHEAFLKKQEEAWKLEVESVEL